MQNKSNKEDYFIECVRKAAKSLGLKHFPRVKVWDGACPYSSGNEIAHAHPDMGLICISRGWLEGLNLDEIKETAFHETAHMLHASHDTEFSTSMDDAHLAAWLEDRKPRTIKFKSKSRDEKKVDKERCNYHLCQKKTKLYRCKYCGNYYCKEHQKPKMVLTLRQINTAREPKRSWLEEEYRSKGHPDWPYTRIAWRKLEVKEKHQTEKVEKALETLRNISSPQAKPPVVIENPPPENHGPPRKIFTAGAFVLLVVVALGIFLLNQQPKLLTEIKASLSKIVSSQNATEAESPKSTLISKPLPSVVSTSIKTLVTNPEQHDGKTVKVRGVLGRSLIPNLCPFGASQSGNGDYKFEFIDEQNYIVYLFTLPDENVRTYRISESYEAEGIFKIKTIDCGEMPTLQGSKTVMVTTYELVPTKMVKLN
jgi:hypothetical protein